MLVQERSKPKSPKFGPPQIRAVSNFSPNLDFSTWFAENLYKIVTVLALIATVAGLFMLRNMGDTAALLCFQTQAESLEKIHMPQLDEKSVQRIFDKTSPYASFRSEKWVVVSVSDYPSEPLRNLVKIRGWQVLAIGNSKRRSKSISFFFHLTPPSSHLLGWFSGRRRTPLRPSLREFAVSSSLTSNPNLSPRPPISDDLKPCLFLLFASPVSDQAIHTHEYRAYQFRTSTRSFDPRSIDPRSIDPRSIDIVNIGPAFRGHYGAFSPSSKFPALPCELRVTPMNVDRGDDSLGPLKQGLKAQSELDMCAEGLELSCLSRLMGSEAVSYTCGVEDLYEKMLKKIETLAKQVEDSSAKIREQALLHACIACSLKPEIDWIGASDLEDDSAKLTPEAHTAAWETLRNAACVLVPGGFGDRGVRAKTGEI